MSIKLSSGKKTGVPGNKNTLSFLNIRTPKTTDFQFGTNGKLMISGSPTLKHYSLNHQL